MKSIATAASTRIIRTLLILSLCLATPMTASADVAWDTLGSFDTGSPIQNATGPTSACFMGWTADRDIGAPFTPAASGEIDFVEMSVCGIENCEGNSVDVWLMSDDAGLPGIILATATFTALPLFSGVPFSDISASSSFAGDLQVDAGTEYWIVLSANNADAIGWQITLLGAGVAGRPAQRYGADPWFLGSESIPGAMRVHTGASVATQDLHWGSVKALY